MSKKRTMNSYQQFIHLSRYARWDYKKERRETWEETVYRYMNFFEKNFLDQLWMKKMRHGKILVT